MCDTKQGLFVLKETKFTNQRIPALYDLYQHMMTQGFFDVDSIVKNKEGSIVSVSEEGTQFVLKKWFYGKECDNRREQDIIEAVRNLANLHQIMREPFEGSLGGAESKQSEFLRHNRELKKVRSYVRNRVGKSEFEFVFLKNFDAMYYWAEMASERLQCEKYKMLEEQNREEKRIVHGDYNYHNVLFTSSGIATTNFEHFYGGMQVTDLYYFLRKIMEKNHWNVRLGMKMIEEYDKILSLTETEREYMALCLTYPEKFWKVANSYYRSRKSWISEKTLEKLEIAIRQIEEKKQFVKTVFSFQAD